MGPNARAIGRDKLTTPDAPSCILAQLEEELRVRIEGWEHENQEAFLVSGQQFMEYVAEQWQLFRLEKEKEKQERQLKKSRQIEGELLYGAVANPPAKRCVLGPHVPGKVRKLGQSAWPPGHAAVQPPRSGLKERNKENVPQLHGPGLSGGCTPTSNYGVKSVASTYSEFARQLSKASRSDTSSTTTTTLHC
ncbi:hypothetical protein Y1Q_0011206 [Alligator mississippiensis]|uniref:Protein regulator of cytokinesis 1 n=1 Tax=Alligator mississippiensis TaxID=8496 RepID=A0A151NYM5_ALLMI|nr:hypothetical protein Y1Q_0011206 [Alligator mississippiensis]